MEEGCGPRRSALRRPFRRDGHERTRRRWRRNDRLDAWKGAWKRIRFEDTMREATDGADAWNVRLQECELRLEASWENPLQMTVRDENADDWK